jgi:GntR family transcriptional regulator
VSRGEPTRTAQIAADLRRQIEQGEIPPGGRLPSLRAMEAKYEVARGTLEAALKVLRAEGLVVSVLGSGTFVRDQPRVVRLARNRLSRAERARTGGAFSADMAAVGLEPRVETEIGLDEADSALALDLGVEEGSQVVTRRRRMYGSNTPMQLATSYFPADIARGTAIERRDTGQGGVYARIEELGHVLVSPFVERVSARTPSRVEQDWFTLPDGVPLLAVVRIARTADRPVEVNRILLRGDWYEVEYEIAAD